MDFLRKYIIFLLVLCALPVSLQAGSNPCDTENFLLAALNRPTIGDSACVAKNKTIIIESGYEYQALRDGTNLQLYPDSSLRFGLPNHSELVFIGLNYNQIKSRSAYGASAQGIGIKHQLAAASRWVVSVESIFTLPSGSKEFGIKGLGETFNGIWVYNLNDTLSLTTLLGVSSLNQSRDDGGKNYVSINPDVVLSWSKDKLLLYLELYGQSKTAPDEENGFNMDTGIVYLLYKHMTMDVEFGQRLHGQVGDFEHYVGCGVGFLID